MAGKQSELAKRLTEAVKVADKLVRDIQKGTNQLIELAGELKEWGRREEDSEKD